MYSRSSKRKNLWLMVLLATIMVLGLVAIAYGITGLV